MAEREPHHAVPRITALNVFDHAIRVAVPAMLAGVVWIYSHIMTAEADIRSLREARDRDRQEANILIAHTRDLMNQQLAAERSRTDSAITEIGRRLAQMEAQTSLLSTQQATANRLLARIEAILEQRTPRPPQSND